eukprot:3799355-Prymnesium_polylepis.1
MADAEMLEEAASAGPSVRQFAKGKLPEKVKTSKVRTGKVQKRKRSQQKPNHRTDTVAKQLDGPV